jgi:hypothetical protein
MEDWNDECKIIMQSSNWKKYKGGECRVECWNVVTMEK